MQSMIHISFSSQRQTARQTENFNISSAAAAGKHARSIEFIMVQMFPSKIVVLRYKAPPIDNINDGEGHREENA